MLNKIVKLFKKNKKSLKLFKKNNIFDFKNSKFNNCIFFGNDNVVQISNNCKFTNCIFHLGNNNRLTIMENVYAKNAIFWFEDSNNFILIDKNTKFCGDIELAVMEGTQIKIGKDCLFSSNIKIRTGDSHKVIDNNGIRTNLSKNIVIKNHVWVGQLVYILKGSQIEDNCIIGCCSVVNSNFPNNSCIAGNPARIVKKDINWDY